MKSKLPRIPMTGILALAVFATAMASTLAVAEQADPTTTMWYAKPALTWSREALPIGNGRIGAMIFGKVSHERISLNEETVWSGMQTNWNRPDANRNLPKIRELLLAGKNDEAEALVNETFTCTGGGSRGGASGPWGCYQELGNLHIVWASDVESVPLNGWKYRMVTTPGITDIRKHRAEVGRQIERDTNVDVDDRGWSGYVIADGKAVEGGRTFNLNDKAILRCHVTLTKDQVAGLGVLRIGPRARNGRVYVNGEPILPAPAVPDRRQLRRHVGYRRDAVAEPWRRDPTAARAA